MSEGIFQSDLGDETEFTRYSDTNDSFRSGTKYLKIKRLVLRLSQNKNFQVMFTINLSMLSETAFNFALKYFDLEKESENCFYDYNGDAFFERNRIYALSDVLTSLYENDRSFFQTFFSFVLKEGQGYFNSNDIDLIKDELLALDFIYDGQLLRTTSGVPAFGAKMTTMIEEELKKINPKLVEMRQGALEALLSNKPDKHRHVSASCRALVDTLLRDLVPEVTVVEGESKIKRRIKTIFNDTKSVELVDATTKFIQALNDAQAKGDHSSITEEASIYVFEITVLLHKRVPTGTLE